MVIIAVLIVSGTIVYSQYLAGKIATEERKNVAAWVEAQRTILFSWSFRYMIPFYRKF